MLLRYRFDFIHAVEDGSFMGIGRQPHLIFSLAIDSVYIAHHHHAVHFVTRGAYLGARAARASSCQAHLHIHCHFDILPTAMLEARRFKLAALCRRS